MILYNIIYYISIFFIPQITFVLTRRDIQGSQDGNDTEDGAIFADVTMSA